jgi:hypothetical protein
MKLGHAIPFAVASAVILASVAAGGAAGGSAAAKQRVTITSKDLPDGTFVLTPYQGGAIRQDTGTTSIVIGQPTRVMREGQSFEIYQLVWTFTGKRGTLTIRERNEWLDTGDAYVAYGRWSVVRGTGQYANVNGGGRSAGVGHNRGNGAWFAQHAGFLTAA